MNKFPIYKFNDEDVQNQLVRLVQLEESSSYIFDTFHTHEYNEMLVLSQEEEHIILILKSMIFVIILFIYWPQMIYTG